MRASFVGYSSLRRRGQACTLFAQDMMLLHQVAVRMAFSSRRYPPLGRSLSPCHLLRAHSDPVLAVKNISKYCATSNAPSSASSVQNSIPGSYIIF